LWGWLGLVIVSCNSPPILDEDTRQARLAGGGGQGDDEGGAGGESGAGGSAGAADSYASFSAFCAAIGAAECSDAVLARCQLAATTKDACRAEVSGSCSHQTSEVTRGVGGAGSYKQGAAEACIKAVSDAYATGQISANAHKAIVASCQEVFRAGAPLGSPCRVDTDCDASLGCYLTDVSKGTCQKITPKAVGDDCGAVGDVCGTGLYCGADKACIERQGPGADCSPVTRPCAEDLRCALPDATATAGSCQARLAAGEECASDADCSAGFCALQGDRWRCADPLGFDAGSRGCQNVDGM
jgi:hypothetical protein